MLLNRNVNFCLMKKKEIKRLRNTPSDIPEDLKRYPMTPDEAHSAGFEDPSDWAKDSNGWSMHGNNSIESSGEKKKFTADPNKGGSDFSWPLANDLRLIIKMKFPDESMDLDSMCVKALKNQFHSMQRKLIIASFRNAWEQIKNKFAGNKMRRYHKVHVVQGVKYRVSMDITSTRKVFKNLKITING